jgi:hypothetical protein
VSPFRSEKARKLLHPRNVGFLELLHTVSGVLPLLAVLLLLRIGVLALLSGLSNVRTRLCERRGVRVVQILPMEIESRKAGAT